ncbi:lanC-like protein GCR2 [Pyrus ussuriensis x Pyrus communis]|uniref:LanC-like protein GCR2 n=1 Tax=Pyrus ussuriensis x Pyrus communis TaxID=2448454 RepID=A0A5N5FRF3_9ROSA|nr:lanC-like protein GCR2 [Pyrus ussuriensis x Pyrus communis]
MKHIESMCHSYAGRLVFVPLVLSLQSILVMQCYLTATSQNLKRWLIVSLVSYEQIKLSSDLPNELLYGRAGFLWACSFLNNHIGNGTISTASMRSVVDEIIKAGRQLAKKGRSALMYEWRGKKYWGAAHGLAGIMHVLMSMQLKPDGVEDVKGTLCCMIKNRFPSRNFPSNEGSESDRLVHWCHGAPGVEYLYRAKAFACFLHDRAQRLISEGTMHGGVRPCSLVEGVGGMALLLLDMSEPSEVLFPGYEL